jgi:probable F420-dependent oxidoreductase
VHRAEELGYATFLVDDHFDRALAPLSALALAAEESRTMRVGTYVLANDFRHPAVLAKELATLDVLSDGRLEVGLGAGWRRDDYDQSGIDFDAPRVRVDRFVEGLRIIRGFFAGEPFTYTGRYYAVNDLVGIPRPIQRPYPPLLIGGGSKRILSISAREADIVGINPRTVGGAFEAASLKRERVAEMVDCVRGAAGPRLRDLELSVHAALVAVTNNRVNAAESILRHFGFDDLSVTEFLESPFAQIGTVDQIVETLQERRETFGFSYVVVWDDNLEAYAPVVARLAGQ